MAKQFDEVYRDLKAGNYAPIYFLQGEEAYFIDRISDYIEDHALQEQERSFNQTILYGKDVDVSTILNSARRFPMMSERQVVIVKEAQQIKDLGKEQGQALLENYLNNPLPSTILVFCHKYKSLDRRKKLAKLFDQKAIVVNATRIYDNRIPDWIRTEVKERGHQIDDHAAHILSNSIGNNLERLSNEIDKVLINFSSPTTITPGLVQRFIGISKEYNPFELQKAVASRDIVKANQIIRYFASNPRANPAILIIAVLYGFFSKLLLVHGASDQSDKALASSLKVNPFFVKEYRLAASQYYPLAKVVQNIHHIRKADLQAKGIDAPTAQEGEILKELIFKLMH